jgi:hypothetical protein
MRNGNCIYYSLFWLVCCFSTINNVCLGVQNYVEIKEREVPCISETLPDVDDVRKLSLDFDWSSMAPESDPDVRETLAAARSLLDSDGFGGPIVHRSDEIDEEVPSLEQCIQFLESHAGI